MNSHVHKGHAKLSPMKATPDGVHADGAAADNVSVNGSPTEDVPADGDSAKDAPGGDDLTEEVPSDGVPAEGGSSEVLFLRSLRQRLNLLIQTPPASLLPTTTFEPCSTRPSYKLRRLIHIPARISFPCSA